MILTALTGHEIGKGDNMQHAHDARGDAKANLLIFAQPDFASLLCNERAFHVRQTAPLLRHLNALIKAKSDAKAADKAPLMAARKRSETEPGDCPVHGLAPCRQVKAGKPNAGYVRHFHVMLHTEGLGSFVL